MAGGGGAVGFVIEDGFGGFDDGEEATGALVGDAGVGAFEARADPYVADDVIGEVAEEPEGVDERAVFCAELMEGALGFGDGGEEVVIMGVGGAAGAGEDTATVIEERGGFGAERIAVGGEVGLLEGGGSGVEAVEVGAREHFMEAAIFDELAWGDAGDFCGLFDGPGGGVPAGEGSDGGLAGEEGLPDFLGGMAGAADGSGAGEDDLAWGHWAPPLGWRKARQLLDPPKPSELERIARMGWCLGSLRTRLTSQLGSGSAQLALTGAMP
ncbi:MAG: hypothetical protein RI897_2729 [Verrucomicrobiota bacterium]